MHLDLQLAFCLLNYMPCLTLLCVYVCMFMCVEVHMCMLVRVCVCIHVEIIFNFSCFSSGIIHVVLWDSVSHWDLRLCQVWRLVSSKPQWPSCFYLPAMGLQAPAAIHSFLTGCWGSKWILMFVGQVHQIEWVIFPAPICLKMETKHFVAIEAP